MEKCTLKEIKVKEGELVAEGQTVAVLETAFSS
jgi:pyruvate/2-oxoglutarate dehydrogenase complex dihydrolipoamide acyltransferase (E2) component